MGRHKQDKPRRDRQEPATHDHGKGFSPVVEDFAGQPVNGGLLTELMGASLDGCTSCQDPLLTLLSEDPVTTARLVNVACVAVQGLMGGLPKGLLDPADPSAMASQEFRRLARAGADVDDEAVLASEMWKVTSTMTPSERRAAANSALDLLAGML